MTNPAIDLTPDEALACLEGIACGESEGYPYEVGPRRPTLDEGQWEALIAKLARIADVDPVRARREVFWSGGGRPGYYRESPPTTT